MGLRLSNAAEPYFAVLESAAGPRPPEGEPVRKAGAEEPAGRPEDSALFRVRLKQVQGSRTRSLTIRCGSEGEAHQQALREVEGAWDSIEIKRL